MSEEKITSLPSWLTCPQTMRLFEVLPQAQKTLRFVGGCVRDHLSQRKTLDLDLATSLTPDVVIQSLEKGKIRFVPLGLKYGSLLILLEGYRYEISTLRKDVQTDGRQALIAFTQSWQEDAQRRDFTFNALYLSLDGLLYDPWDGATDLRNQYVRFIGDPSQRLEEDYLRILRYFRFQAWYGGSRLDPSALQACQTYAPNIQALSGERVATELFKLLSAANPLISLRAMDQTHVWPYVIGIPQASLLEKSDQKSHSALSDRVPLETGKRFITYEQDAHLPPDPLCRLMALLPFQPNVFQAVASRLKLLKAQVTKGQKILHILSRLLGQEKRASLLNELLYTYGESLIRPGILLALAAQSSQAEQMTLQDLLHTIPEKWQKPFFPLTGDSLKIRGIPPGPLLGEALHHTQEWWINNHFKPTHLECLDHALFYIHASKNQKAFGPD